MIEAQTLRAVLLTEYRRGQTDSTGGMQGHLIAADKLMITLRRCAGGISGGPDDAIRAFDDAAEAKSDGAVMLEIKNLHVKLADEDKADPQGLSTSTVPKGEVHAIMGPNGSGKSTLAYVLAGRDGYEVTEGDILWNGESLLDMEPDERAAKGVFLAFQYPMEIPGVAGLTFLRTALNAVRKKRGASRTDDAASS